LPTRRVTSRAIEMKFAGLKKGQEIADLIAYLQEVTAQ
jgi:cytochrome c2